MGQLLDHDELISSLEAIKESSRLIINEYVSIIHYCNKCSEYIKTLKIMWTTIDEYIILLYKLKGVNC